MITYSFQAVTQDGLSVAGSDQAESVEVVRASLMDRGYTQITVQELPPAPPEPETPLPSSLLQP
jgi:hypothetical protein